jgi:hypothetical protein
MTDIVAARDLAHRLPETVAAAYRLALLVVGQFRLAAKPDATRLRPLASFGGAGADKFLLELGQARSASSARVVSSCRPMCPPTTRHDFPLMIGKAARARELSVETVPRDTLAPQDDLRRLSSRSASVGTH